MRQQHFKAVCQSCGGSYWTCRSHSKTCGPVCKKRLQRGVDFQGLGRRLGERQKKSPGSKSVPVSPAGEKGTDSGAENQARTRWPHGTEIEWLEYKSRKWKPGRVEWRYHDGAEPDEIEINTGFEIYILPEHFVRMPAKG